MNTLRVKVWLYTIAYAILGFLLACCLTACGTVTTSYGIWMANDQNSSVSIKGIDPHLVDVAWEAAAKLADAPPGVPEGGLALYWDSSEIAYGGKLYDGLTTPPFVRVVYHGPCVVGADTALVHEFLHLALYGVSENMDPNHTLPQWHQVTQVAEALASEYCGGYLPDFKPAEGQ